MKKFIFLASVLFFCSMPNKISAQITIAPTNLFVDGNTRFGTYMVINNSNEPQEISVNFFFSYSLSDSLGVRRYVYDDSVMANKYSIDEYIRAFPRNFVLQANQRQIVRLRINPPSDLNNGTYWTRIRTTSIAQSPAVEMTAENTVSAQVGIKIEQITGLFYKKGDVSTGIVINKIQATPNRELDKLDVLVDYSRTGNSPFLGTITFKLSDQSGKVVSENHISTSLYFGGSFKQSLDISDELKGKFNLEAVFESQRSDVSSQDIVKMQPATKTVTITIP